MHGKVVIVTGGASGIGRAIVDQMLSEGAKVAAFDLPGPALTALDGLNPELRCYGVDIANEMAVTQAVAEIEADFGEIDGVVNSAGIAADTPAMKMEADCFRRILEVNVVGCFIVTRAAVAAMGMRGGAVVNIASVSGMRGNEGRMAYGASKGAVITMGKVLAVELAPVGVRVNTVAPGPVDTPMVLAHHSQEAREGWLNVLPIKRYARPEEIAQAAAFLLDPQRSGFITGHTLAVDGGFLARGMVSGTAAAGRL
ncbi:SDR family NAD(P)-dependent oxidoreductase [Paracoccus actinidiae]|uniref:SDR family NAD(P)-dependent oxidoreductase n=1 Tax=Paracoccus actinidiae TaxID=3064531 RepID=UPI0027D2751B|nr:SDR family oxidoreductase [Paracoccus sp. M09]